MTPSGQKLWASKLTLMHTTASYSIRKAKGAASCNTLKLLYLLVNKFIIKIEDNIEDQEMLEKQFNFILYLCALAILSFPLTLYAESISGDSVPVPGLQRMTTVNIIDST